jgi:hypothetical protein
MLTNPKNSTIRMTADGTTLLENYYSFLIPNVDECVKHSSNG